MWWKKAALGAIGAFVIGGTAQQVDVRDAAKQAIGAALDVVVSDAQAAPRDTRVRGERTRPIRGRNAANQNGGGTGGTGGSTGGSTGGTGGSTGGTGGSTIGGGCR